MHHDQICPCEVSAQCFVEERWAEDKGGSRKTKGEAIVLQAGREDDARGLDLWPADRAMYVWETTNLGDRSEATVREKKESQITRRKLDERTGALSGNMTSLVAEMKYLSVNVQPQAKKTTLAILGTNGFNSWN